MIQTIQNCNNCNLCDNQRPLLDNCQKDATIIVVGLSAKLKKYSDEVPLDNRTFSGKLVLRMDQICQEFGVELYRTNLIKCAPLDKNGHLRYPNLDELSSCYQNFIYELDTINPSMVILFGKIIQDAFEKKLGIKIGQAKIGSFPFAKYNNCIYVASYHPSYIMKSANRQKEYLLSFRTFIENNLERKL